MATATLQNKNASPGEALGATLYKREYTSWYRFVNQFIFAGESVVYGYGVWGAEGEWRENFGRCGYAYEILPRMAGRRAPVAEGTLLGRW